jgi:hypothetical protein
LMTLHGMICPPCKGAVCIPPAKQNALPCWKGVLHSPRRAGRPLSPVWKCRPARS